MSSMGLNRHLKFGPDYQESAVSNVEVELEWALRWKANRMDEIKGPEYKMFQIRQLQHLTLVETRP
jgi:ribosome maturation factor RimP